MQTRIVATPALEIACLEHGPPDGWPCILGHGFPYDVHAYGEVAPRLAAAGARVLVPWLRGYGPTRFRSDETPRSGEQAALGADLLAFMDALGIARAVLGGYDWGGRAACVVAALWPERAEALVTGNSYNIQDIARSGEPLPAIEEAALWYQYYFHSERGRRGLERDRRDIARTLWRMWSPTWAADEATFARTAASLDNPDFVPVVIHSYRHRFGLVPGDPAVAHVETRLTAQPAIAVPTVAIDGDADGVSPGTAHHRRHFGGPFEYQVFRGAGHNLPQERPADWADAVLAARRLAAG
jgi:pimeloyl-ACP methyl ester carboxylesterase